MATLYERLNYLCEQKGVKGGRMCVELGFSKSLMTDLKSGRKKSVNAETAQKLASYFGVSVAYLLGEEDKKNNTPDKRELTESEKMLLDLFNQVPEESQQMVLEMIRIALKK